jgi:hypothetical protein
MDIYKSVVDEIIEWVRLRKSHLEWSKDYAMLIDRVQMASLNLSTYIHDVDDYSISSKEEAEASTKAGRSWRDRQERDHSTREGVQ